MTRDNWEVVVELLQCQTGPATSGQRKMAAALDVKIGRDTPRLVADGILRSLVNREVALSGPVTPRQQRCLELLNASGAASSFSPATEQEAEGVIAHLRLSSRAQALKELKLGAGDVVKTHDGSLEVVSSIGTNGKVYFKGGRGQCSWPDGLNVVARSSDRSPRAKKFRRDAENAATFSQRRLSWSVARAAELEENLVEAKLSPKDISILRDTVERSDDERPIQQLIEERPQLLTTLIGGKWRYCIPQKRLGGEFVPDFVIGSVDSLGVHWTLVELETPASGIYIQRGDRFDSSTHKGLSQILDWRTWLANNLSYAKRRRSENGLGLFDIRPKPPALVLVGRRRLMPGTRDAQRHEHRESAQIEIHTYDWLLDQLEGQIGHTGPPWDNPYGLEGRHGD